MTNINNHKANLVNLTIPEDFLSKIYLARCAFNYSTACTSPKAKIGDFNIWDRALTLQETLDWTTCRVWAKGNIVNWNKASFELENMEVVENAVCQIPEPGHVGFYSKMTFNSLRRACQNYKGQVAVVRNQEMMTQFKTAIDMHNQSCYVFDKAKFWAGWTDEESDDFIAADNGEKLSDFQPWFLGEPNGEDLENCVVVEGRRNAWNDELCSHEFCGFCYVPRRHVLHIRGLCEESKLDDAYAWIQSKASRNVFRGLTVSTIWFETYDQQWIIKNYDEQEVVATLDDNVLMGTKQWNIENDGCGGGNETWLSVTLCDEDEFNCDSGQCVDMEKRCDGVIDCHDSSDETECAIVKVNDGYMPHMAPSQNDDNTTTTIHVALYVVSVLGISEVDNHISFQFQLLMTWSDPRLLFRHLKKTRATSNNNINSEAQEGIIWIPEALFYNTRDKQRSIVDEDALAYVTRLGEPELNDMSALRATTWFPGDENPITIRRIYAVDFICDFNMANYPFDLQTCTMEISMKASDRAFVTMAINDYDYNGPADLIKYYVRSYNMTTKMNREEGNRQVAIFTIEFSRRLMGPILTTYLPTVLICIVSFCTNFFKGEYFEAAVTVNLTSLLLLTTVYISISNSLPETSYIKMIDVWMIFNLFVPFAEVLLLTIVDNCDKIKAWETMKENKFGLKPVNKYKMWKRFANIGMPIIYIVFVIGYFLIGCKMSQ